MSVGKAGNRHRSRISPSLTPATKAALALPELPRRRLRLGWLVLAALVLAVLAWGMRGRAAPSDEVNRREWGIGGFKTPPRWEVLPQDRQSYPEMLAWASRGQGAERSVITLVGRRL